MSQLSKKMEGYLPDSKSRREKVILGLSGGIHSYVAAYLLKIQNYDLIGVTVINNWEDYGGDQEKVLSCHLSQSKQDEIKEFCGKLGIPYWPVKVSEFKEVVIEPWIASKVSGKYPVQCWNCHDLRISTLYKTMNESGATRIATGHFAKLLLNDQTKEVMIHTSNDEVEDQSVLLARLSHDILSKLILPLSDLTQKEVIKLAENFGVIPKHKTVNIHDCLNLNQELDDYLNTKVPVTFLKPGEIISEGQNLGQHSGIHHYSYGSRFEAANLNRNEKKFISGFKFSDKSITLNDESVFTNTKLQILNCFFSDGLNFTEPFKGFLSLKDEKYIECWIHPKSLNSVYLELPEEHKFLNGEIVSVLKKKGKNSKTLLTGEVKLLPRDIDEGEKSESKVNYRIDF